jgi:hypothetical protein
MVTSPSPTAPGYSEAEKLLLQELFDELAGFITAADWEQQLPFAASWAYVLQWLGNPVQLTLQLYRHVSKTRNQEEIKLRLDVNVQGTGKEKWTAADGGCFLSHGPAAQVAAAARAFQADVRPVQDRLATDYRGTFYSL